MHGYTSGTNDVDEVEGAVTQVKPQGNNGSKHLSPCYQGIHYGLGSKEIDWL